MDPAERDGFPEHMLSHGAYQQSSEQMGRDDDRSSTRSWDLGHQAAARAGPDSKEGRRDAPISQKSLDRE